MRLILTERYIRRANRQRDIELLMANPDGPQNFLLHPWEGWFKNGVLAHIYQALQEGERRGVTRRKIVTTAMAAHPSLTLAGCQRLYQKSALSLLWDEQADVERRIRDKLQRWKLPDAPRRCAARAKARIGAAFRLAPPRVAYAYFSL